MSAYLQLPRAGEHTQAHRHVASRVYHAAEGGGFSIIGGQRFDWTEGDTFVVPAWAWHEHASQGGEAVLFSFAGRPVLQALGLQREKPLAHGRHSGYQARRHARRRAHPESKQPRPRPAERRSGGGY